MRAASNKCEKVKRTLCPCPNCGGKAVIRNVPRHIYVYNIAVCPDCGFNAGVKRNELRAADAWNALCASATRKQSRTKVPVGVTVATSKSEQMETGK
jgi:predicted RNA-binding Zn-ribbon protein involved in translation (DUF1610 family)